ncbi:MAG: DUF1549 domain-containing protein, partial [Verrucomicrobiota bacterium]
DRNFTYHQAWRYRNYVIDAFNEDLSYYRFVREQIAGDLLEEQENGLRQRALIASGFLSLGPKMLTERDKEKLRMDVADEQVDTIGRAFLGLTLGCARCHDHKFDPVSQKDYYAMAGILRSTDTVWGTRNGDVNVSTWQVRALADKDAGRLKRLDTAMRLSVQKSYRKKAGAANSPSSLPFGGIVLDDTDAEVTGSWRTSTYAKRFYGKGYLVHHIKEGAEPRRLTFRAVLPETTLYEIRLGYKGEPNRHPAVPIRIHGQEEHHVTLNQQTVPEVETLFQPLGRFVCEKDVETRVVIESDDKEGYIIVDALQFIPVTDLDEEKKALAAAKAGREKIDPESIEALYFMSQGDLKKEVSKGIKALQKADVAIAAACATRRTLLKGRSHQGQT